MELVGLKTVLVTERCSPRQFYRVSQIVYDDHDNDNDFSLVHLVSPSYVTGRNAAQRGFHPTRKPSINWFKVPPEVPLTPAVPFSSRVSAGINPPLGRVSSVKIRA